MNDQPYDSFYINERSQVGLLKKLLKQLGIKAGLSTYQLAKLDIIASEIASNLLKHATPPGQILFREVAQMANSGIEIIGIDNGPGMQDVSRLMLDGVSTTSTLGTGIGAIRRLSDQFDIYSRPGWGTLLLSRIFKGEYDPSSVDEEIDYAALRVPYPGESVCGDGVSYKKEGNTHSFLVTDGLGHGPHAHEASVQAAAAFQRASATDPSALIQSVHQSITHTRGAVGTALTIKISDQMAEYYGVGNISLRMIQKNASERGITAQGILGQNIRQRLSVRTLACQGHAWLILHSDGLSEKWKIENYPGLLGRDLALIAAALYKDHQRGKDDCALLVIYLKKPV